MHELGGVNSQRITKVGLSSVSHINRDSDIAPTCACKLCEGELKLGIMAPTSTLVQERVAPTVLALKPDNSVSLHMHLTLFELLFHHWRLGHVFVSE